MSSLSDFLLTTFDPTGAVKNPVGLDIFEEEPVPLEVFVSDKKFLANPPLSAVQYDAIRHIERVYFPETYKLLAAELDPKKTVSSIGPAGIFRRDKDRHAYWAHPIPMKNLFTLQWGKGGGKDHTCRISSLRIAYLLLCLKSPQEYYEMPPQDTIHLLNVASSSPQALEAFFNPMKRVTSRTWFADKAVPHVNKISYAKNLEAISGHSDAETQEGLNLILGVADEIDAFRSNAEVVARRGAEARPPTNSAEALLEMLQTSAKTRFPEVYKRLAISFPRYQGSTIQRLTTKGVIDIAAKGDASPHYVSGPYATWDVNPRVKGPEAFADDYESDPEMARGKYECRPSKSLNPYFRNDVAVRSAMVEREVPAVHVDYEADDAGWYPVYTFAPDFYPVPGAIYAMHADLAVTNDRAGVALAHVVDYREYEKMVEAEDGELLPFTERRPEVKVDLAVTFEASKTTTPVREIQIRWARQLCFQLMSMGFPVVRFTFDGFESRDSMQILESRGIESERVSTDLSKVPWQTLRDLMYDARIKMPHSQLLEDEILGLTLMPNGKVDHLFGGSKDLADAVACAAMGAVVVGGREDSEGGRAWYEPAVFTVGGQVEKMPGGVSRLGMPVGFGGLFT